MIVVGGNGVGKILFVKGLSYIKDWWISGVGLIIMIDGIEIFFMNFMDCRLKVFDLGGDEVMFSLYYFFLLENIFY